MQDVVLIEKLINQVPNKYEAVRVIAKEARRINSLLIRGAGEIDEKPTMMALQRLLDGKVKHDYVDPERRGPLFADEDEDEA